MTRRERRKAAQRKRNREADRRHRKKIPAWPLFIASALVAAVGVFNLVSPRSFTMSGGTGHHGHNWVRGFIDTDGSRFLGSILTVIAIGILFVAIKVVRSQQAPPED